MKTIATLVRAAAALAFVLALSPTTQAAQPSCMGGESGDARVALCATSYSVTQPTGSVHLTVKRGGVGTSAISVGYSTANGTAIAGTNYTATSGVLHWAENDWTPRTISVPIWTEPAISGSKSFMLVLSKPSTGVSIVYPESATVTIAGPTTSGSESVAFSASTFSMTQSTGSVAIPVNRSGGTTGAVTVAYATSNGTAVAGQNYTAQSGTLSWAAGDTTAKSIVVPISSTVISGTMTFGLALSKPTGATVGAPATAIVSINKSSAFAISVSGNRFVDGAGNTVQLRGVAVPMDGVAIEGWDPSNPWGNNTGTSTPDWNAMKAWGTNAVRITLNEASWLGLSCVDNNGTSVHFVNGVKTQDTPGETIQADPGGNYQATVAKGVADATTAGLYVIVDLHLSAPGNNCPTAQNSMADADHSIAYWTSLATAFKGYPNVIFELFNEPFLDQAHLLDSTPWADLINGTADIPAFIVAGTPYSIPYTWHNAGMQQMLDAVRATGAKNVILTSTLAYSTSMGGWLQYHPTDTLSPSQIGAVWHAYPPSSSSTLVNCVGEPACSAQTYIDVQNILAAGYPVAITEFCDAVGGTTAPFASILLPFADTHGISYMAWTWDIWPGPSNYLITDAAGDPSAGYGTYVKAHYLCRAAGTAVCP